MIKIMIIMMKKMVIKILLLIVEKINQKTHVVKLKQ
jgi:hypothetical protein